MSDPFTLIDCRLKSHGVAISSLSDKHIVLDYLGFEDSKGADIYRGDVVRIDYMDRTASIFELMKKLGHTYIYLFFDVETPYYTTAYRSHDENTYYTGGSVNGDSVMFLRYIFENLKCAEKIGNIFSNPNLLDLIVK